MKQQLQMAACKDFKRYGNYGRRSLQWARHDCRHCHLVQA